MLSPKNERSGTGSKERIGELLVRERLIDERQLEIALARQRNLPGYQPLGEVCRQLGFITRRDLRSVLLKHRKQISLGNLLLRLGLLTEAQLIEALNDQGMSGERLGEILVRKRLLTESVLKDTLSIQLGIEKNDANNRLVDRTLLKGVNAAFLRRKRVLPLFHDKGKGVLTVMMEDPTDVETISDLEKMFRTRVEPTILTSGAVSTFLNEIFDVWFSSN
jgi:hypothetical protein